MTKSFITLAMCKKVLLGILKDDVGIGFVSRGISNKSFPRDCIGQSLAPQTVSNFQNNYKNSLPLFYIFICMRGVKLSLVRLGEARLDWVGMGRLYLGYVRYNYLFIIYI
jgi:hypothetical protein